jgi:hypothetical protein
MFVLNFNGSMNAQEVGQLGEELPAECGVPLKGEKI